MTRSAYPFGERKYQIPSSRNVKRALPIANIRDIMNYPVRNPFEVKRDLWMFTYLCNGTNMKDIAKLRYKNISSDTIVFLRSKSERSTKKDLKPIVVVICDELKTSIDKWENPSKLPDNFVFGILQGTETSKVEVNRIKQFTKTVNKHTKRIGLSLGINVKLTT